MDGVTIWVDPYPFSFAHNLYEALRQVLMEDQHDLMLDHATTVTVEEPPTSFSPFSSTNCTLFSHFLFNDFIAVAFLDLAKDLDVQI